MVALRSPTIEEGPAGPTNRLRAWRIDHELSLEEVAGLTGLSASMLSLVERGKRQLAPLTKVRVARRLGARVEDLFIVEPIDEEAKSAAV
jgi:transcriptional regulator with XRE-family HTH domain